MALRTLRLEYCWAFYVFFCKCEVSDKTQEQLEKLNCQETQNRTEKVQLMFQ